MVYNKVMRTKTDSELLIGALIILCFVMAFISFRQKQFRRQLNEVKELPYQGITVDSLEDGIYTGQAITTFLSLDLEIEVENKTYKAITIVNCSEDKTADIQKLIDELLAEGSLKVPSKKKGMLEYLVFISCLDQAKKN